MGHMRSLRARLRARASAPEFGGVWHRRSVDFVLRIALVAAVVAATALLTGINRSDRGSLRDEAGSLTDASSPPTARFPPASGSRIRPAARSLLSDTYPTDVFSEDQLSSGAVLLHIIGVSYMFVALSVVCDEFFVPSLDVIVERLGIGEDIAGATFMAAGGSAPELFTSLIGTLISTSDVGFGTIVGSAVFNVLFVIAVCALASKELLHLTWWPLFRDSTYYAVSLGVLVLFFGNGSIEWYEAVILFAMYFGYVAVMAFNARLKRFVFKCLRKPVEAEDVTQAEAEAIAHHPSLAARPEFALRHQSVTFRAGVLQMMLTQDKEAVDAQNSRNARFRKTVMLVNEQQVKPRPSQVAPATGGMAALADAASGDGAKGRGGGGADLSRAETPTGADAAGQAAGPTEEDGDRALSIAFPDGWKNRVLYVLLAPLTFALYYTVPDVRRPHQRKYFVATFAMSILWIAVFSYLMVWWATVTGDTLGIPEAVMGLTFLAAGTSIPDLLTSVIVARQGFGDMAVSSSIGSNIFDVLVGLPVPWILYHIIFQKPITVQSDSLVSSVLILAVMLIAVITTIALSGWVLSKPLAGVMFLLYAVFVVQALMAEYGVFSYPF